MNDGPVTMPEKENGAHSDWYWVSRVIAAEMIAGQSAIYNISMPSQHLPEHAK